MKKLIVILICLACCLTVSGCHGKKQYPELEIPSGFDTSREYELVFWAKNDTNKTQVAIYNKAVEDFEKLYPNITVKIRFYTDYNAIYNDVITNISTHTTPNVCISYPDHIATYLTGMNIMAPLDQFISDDKYGFGGSEVRYQSGNYGPQADDSALNKFLKEGYLNGQLYAIPFMRSTEAAYINKDLVNKLIKEDKQLHNKYGSYDWENEILSWEFLFDISQAAMDSYDEETKIYGVNNQTTMVPFIYKSTDNMMIQMLQQLDNSGALYSDSEGTIKIFNDKTKQILEYISDFGLSKAFSTFKISSYPGNKLNASQALVGIDSTAGATWMGGKAPLQDVHGSVLTDFETVVKMIPQYDPSNPQMISQGPSLCIFNKEDPQEVLASWLFVQYLLSNDVQIAYSETEGYVPVTSAAQQSEVYQDYLSKEGQPDLDEDGKETGKYYDVKIKATKLLLDALDNDYLFTTAVFNGSASLRNAAGELIEEIVKGVRRGETVPASVDKQQCDQYIDEIYQKMNSLYRLDQTGEISKQKNELGPLPQASKMLLGTLVVVWIGIGSYYLYDKKKNKKK